jgi:hypothetical protein
VNLIGGSHYYCAQSNLKTAGAHARAGAVHSSLRLDMLKVISTSGCTIHLMSSKLNCMVATMEHHRQMPSMAIDNSLQYKCYHRCSTEPEREIQMRFSGYWVLRTGKTRKATISAPGRPPTRMLGRLSPEAETRLLH